MGKTIWLEGAAWYGYAVVLIAVLAFVLLFVPRRKSPQEELAEQIHNCTDASVAFALMDQAALQGWADLAEDAAWKGFQLRYPRLWSIFMEEDTKTTRALLEDPEFLGIEPAEGKGRIQGVVRTQLRILEELEKTD